VAAIYIIKGSSFGSIINKGTRMLFVHCILYFNSIVKEITTAFTSYPVDVEHSHVRFLGNLVLNLWDCGGYVVILYYIIESMFNHVFVEFKVFIFII